MWNDLAVPNDAPVEPFDPDTLADLPAPAARWLHRALAPGTPLVSRVQIAMTGEIRLGNRWWPFHAEQILRAGVGFVWRPVVGGRLMRVVGADVYGPDDAVMDFRLHGLVPVAHSVGADTTRSAAGRLAAETVAWLPQAVAPQAGAEWSDIDDEWARVEVNSGVNPLCVGVRVHTDGRLRAIAVQRWNDGADPPHYEPFGARITGEFVTPGGVRVAGSGQAGWGWGTAAFERRSFFRFAVTDLSVAGSATIPPRPAVAARMD